MFMFWGKRTSYTKRLLKAQVRGEHETECEAQENQNHHNNKNKRNIKTRNAANSPELSSSSSSPASPSSSSNKSSRCPLAGGSSKKNGSSSYSAAAATSISSNFSFSDSHNRLDNSASSRTARCKELLKTLKENQLEMLLAAVESYGANLSGCVMVKRRRRGGSELDSTESDKVKEFFKSKCFRDEDRNESMEMTSADVNTSQSNVDRNSHCYPHHHHHHHHRNHRHNNHSHNSRNGHNSNRHSCNNHNRRNRSSQQNLNTKCNDDDICEYDDDQDECKDGSKFKDGDNFRRDFYRDCDDDNQDVVIGDERLNTATTTTTTTTTSSRRCVRNSGSNNNNINNSEITVDPHLLCCQIWRWPDLNNSSELKRLPVCHSATEDPVDVCCNPYHWSRLCKPESPPPPYCLIADRLRPEDRAPSEGDAQHRSRNTNSPPLPGSLTTNGEDLSGQREWCTLAYWELGGRVGRLYPVEPSTVNVFDSLLDGDGLCLATLAENHHSTSPAIQRTRSKIGLGLMLSQESDGVWAYNRSENPIFVNSPTLDDPESRTLLVYRVPPGFCLNIFDRSKTVQLRSSSSSSSSSSTYDPMSSPSSVCQGGVTPGIGGGLTSGPVDVNSVRISFAKGWGPKYSRQEVTSCPCWLEVLLAPCR